MFRTLATLLLAALVLILIGAGVVYSGVVNVAADTPHSAPVRALLETARQRSIAVRADDILVPDLSDAELIQSGAGNYDAMCAMCHLAPGVQSATWWFITWRWSSGAVYGTETTSIGACPASAG
ncbi:hypothetical protein M0M42_06670 [Pseudomonas knackmussii]|uniref:Cytochrome c domain-containing protein n=1 Tax=Pseudomonas knackmussii TaxID=65741 RepID=A0ABY4KTQ7_9PSED|nr:hypothetical protein [Pseudomonas knackmussii]UPQ84079.1 hypothetical protein M0M42_06670 [Pseudomonas knackmussii]